MKAILALEDGEVFEGLSFGAQGEHYGEVVFNTGMTGYQEVLSDPSYKGQIVTMTYPLMGNYGVRDADSESRALWLEGFVIRELSAVVSNWGAEASLADYLKARGVPGIQQVDTRRLTKHIRTAGALRAVISTTDPDPARLIAKVRRSPEMIGRDLVRDVTCNSTYTFCRQGGPRVAVLDFGVKTSILRQLEAQGCDVEVLPAVTPVDAILALKPDGILLSNGPGDPAAVTYAIRTVRTLAYETNVPLFGICLGHQLMGLALGGTTYKLKFGHHGANHPVKDTMSGRIDITVQNHGFCVDLASLDPGAVEVTHLNLNDQTVEGMRHRKLPVFSVQFHPEAGPGPHDARHLFGRFVDLMEGCGGSRRWV